MEEAAKILLGSIAVYIAIAACSAGTTGPGPRARQRAIQ